MPRSKLVTFCRARPRAYPLLSLILAATPGCDDPDLLSVDLEDDVAERELLWESDECVDFPSLPSSQATVWEVLPPVRMDDLKPNHYMRIDKVSGWWHDMNIWRHDGGWSDLKPEGGSGEEASLTWGTPVYAGVDGEVMACWRTAPYDVFYSSVWHKLGGGGNFLIIKSGDRYLNYAHLDTNTIPSALCPHVSTNGGYMAAVSDNPDHKCNVNNSVNQRVCDISGCPTTETYIPRGSRPQIHAGQFIGRAGAIGNAAGAHIHVDGGFVDETGPVDRLKTRMMQLSFENSWQAPFTGAAPQITWTSITGTALKTALTTDTVLLWSGKKREETYASPDYRLSKFGGGVGVDLLCHDTDQGNLYIDGNDTPVPYGATNWQGSATWCTAASARLHTGDFNGDGRTDLLCHDRETGVIKIDHGVFNAVNGYTEYTGVNFTRPNPWCNTDTRQLLIGNFDGDTKDDLLCHDHADGSRWLDRSSNGFNLTDHSFPTPWCAGHYQRLHVGRFDALSVGDDLLCHDTLTGQIWIDATPDSTLIANGAPIFGATDTHVDPWCAGRGNRLFSGNVVTSGNSWYDELICHDSDTGRVYINNAGTNFDYPITSSSSVASGHCTGKYDRVKIGDVNGDGKDDLVCFNFETGARSVDYATLETSTGGLFAGAEWTSSDNGWCRDADEALR